MINNDTCASVFGAVITRPSKQVSFAVDRCNTLHHAHCVVHECGRSVW